MREFAFDFKGLLSLPLRRFWFLVNHVDRLRAEEQLMQLQLMGAAGSAELYEQAHNMLSERAGRIFIWKEEIPAEFEFDPETGRDPEFDRAGLMELKALSGAA